MTSEKWTGHRSDLTPATLLQARTAEDPEAVYITFSGRDPISREQMLSAATELAGRLKTLGAKRGSTVATYMETRREITECWFACALLGAVFMPLNVALRGTFLNHQLSRSEAEILLTEGSKLRYALAGCEGSSVSTVVLTDPQSAGTDTPPASVRLLDPHEFEALIPSELDPDEMGQWRDPALILFTSGTTGQSKAVVMSHHYVMTMAQIYAKNLAMRAGDVFYGPLPMYHLSGTIVATLTPLTVGATSFVDPVFSVSNFWPRIRELGATQVILVGGMPQMLWQRQVEDAEKNNSLRAAVVIPLSADIYHAFERRFGLTVVTGYGSSEAGQITFSSVEHPAVPGTAGRPVDSHEVLVVNDDDEPLAPGEVGEIIVRPRVPHVSFEGYRGDSEATVAATRNLWFHTGDLGVFDAEGNLSFADRKKDYLRRRGENISSFEVEYALLSHPNVLEAAVVGVPSELGEDEVKAYVVVRPGEDIDEVELLRHSAETMPYFAIPRFIALVPELPRSAVGRIQKFILREQHKAAPGWDRDSSGYRLNRHNVDDFLASPRGFVG